MTTFPSATATSPFALTPPSPPQIATSGLDLVPFWRDVYPTLLPDLKRRFPDQDLPDDPMSLVPSDPLPEEPMSLLLADLLPEFEQMAKEVMQPI